MNITRSAAFLAPILVCAHPAAKAATNEVADLGTVLVEGTALSRYRPATVSGATFSSDAIIKTVNATASKLSK